MPKGDARGAMYGFQLWANLPAADKMSEPRYRSIARRASTRSSPDTADP
jgi:redox-sensitive bicupin YhaK (pirin superfamily)